MPKVPADEPSLRVCRFLGLMNRELGGIMTDNVDDKHLLDELRHIEGFPFG